MKLLKDQNKSYNRIYSKYKNQNYQERKIKSSSGIKNNENSPGPSQYGNNYNINQEFENENENYDINEQFTEELNVIQSLWDDLGVTDNYRIIFESLSRFMDSKMKKDLFDYEMNALKKFSDCLLV